MRDRMLHIVELKNGNWATITRDLKEAKWARDDWNKRHKGEAVILSFKVPTLKEIKAEKETLDKLVIKASALAEQAVDALLLAKKLVSELDELWTKISRYGLPDNEKKKEEE